MAQLEGTLRYPACLVRRVFLAARDPLCAALQDTLPPLAHLPARFALPAPFVLLAPFNRRYALPVLFTANREHRPFSSVHSVPLVFLARKTQHRVRLALQERLALRARRSAAPRASLGSTVRCLVSPPARCALPARSAAPLGAPAGPLVRPARQARTVCKAPRRARSRHPRALWAPFPSHPPCASPAALESTGLRAAPPRRRPARCVTQGRIIQTWGLLGFGSASSVRLARTTPFPGPPTCPLA
jgi:hypothetical protein